MIALRSRRMFRPEIPEEDVELEYGIDGTQALTFVAKTLTDRLSARLQGRAVAASRVELELQLDAAMLTANDKQREPLRIVGLDLPAPLSGAADLLAALRPKIRACRPRGSRARAKLRAPVLVHKRALALSLFEPEPKAERALPRLVGELFPISAPIASRRSFSETAGRRRPLEARPFGRPKAKRRTRKKLRRPVVSRVPEPTRLFPSRVSFRARAFRVTRQLSRLEAVEWWRRPPRVARCITEGALGLARVDYVQAWTDDGEARAGGRLNRASGTTRIRGWFD